MAEASTLEVVQGTAEAKKAAYLTLVGSTCEEERRACMEWYKVSRKEAKLAVTEAKIATYGRMYEEPGKRREKKLFRLSKTRGIKDRDLDQVRCIKDEDGKLEHFESHRDFRYCRRIKVDEVVGAMRKMSSASVIGPDEIPVELWKY
ncbi:PREDICTED: uncharacterized protein LOC109241220 [Nicotiana attenuata]|uniref:uncharacterized protein LOC109241220 n=1 Tax=Nicotiana attenuata TaxID=49451 RepID=UPI000905540F|nr:PREDICTED: uncharacterized protein LOC109241220 [Nicotiana attenuata]